MSAKRWALSAFFVWHVMAIGLGSLASPGAVVEVGPPRQPTNDPIAAALTPELDMMAAVVAPVLERVIDAAAPLQRWAAWYLGLTGVAQSWKMFSNPPEVHQYLRIRYYIGRTATDSASGEPAWTATELVFPAHREDEVRLVEGYWAAFRDKAMTSALQRFHEHRHPRLLKVDTKSAELPDDLAPIARYFATRYQDRALGPGERIVRAEVWYGVAPMPPPGGTYDRERTDARMSVLRGYYEGPIENHFGRPVSVPYHSSEIEADITWVLEYFEP